MFSRARPRGFVLPTTLLVMTLMTVMLTAAFILVSAEARSTDNSFASQRALAIAEAGMENYLSRNLNLGVSTAYDSTTTPINFSNGYAVVAASRLVDTSQGPLAIWLVRSYGYVTDPRLSGQTQARRVVARLARYSAVVLPARAALVALNGVDVEGAAGLNNPLDGRDNNGSISGCTAPSGFAADTNAVTTPPGGYTYANALPVPGGGGTEALASIAATYDSTHIDWATILSGGFTPDYTQSGGTLNYPAPAPATNTAWEVGYVTGNITIPGYAGFPSPLAQQGVLIVTGNVTMADRAHWDGIIIAGGKLEGASSTSQFLVHGMVVTGLNCVTGVCPAKNHLWRGNNPSTTYRKIQWSWCWAHIGVGMLAAMAPIKSTFIDNWAAY
jgi:hypothetical protein